ncbi:unnamed protein product [Paramecium octaurelia]|uniref:Uncharacterized protein n=1 Tax=Paramecium octaurelia TaxID=43137 RepID=A0A8S1UY61_PAROT|nr:unnamed protein product [Paramecium octaurelia]
MNSPTSTNIPFRIYLALHFIVILMRIWDTNMMHQLFFCNVLLDPFQYSFKTISQILNSSLTFLILNSNILCHNGFKFLFQTLYTQSDDGFQLRLFKCYFCLQLMQYTTTIMISYWSLYHNFRIAFSKYIHPICRASTPYHNKI